MLRARRGIIDPQRQPDLRAIGMPIGLRHHADDRVGQSVEPNGLAEDILAAAKILLPEIVADDHHRRGARLIFRGKKIAPEHR